jgi:hypothetical protein
MMRGEREREREREREKHDTELSDSTTIARTKEKKCKEHVGRG